MPSDAEILAVMREKGAPWGYRFRDGGRRPALVSALIDHVTERLGDVPDLDERVDRCVRAQGGARETTDMDLDDLPRRLARLRRRSTPRRELYVMPQEFFDRAGT